MNMTLAHPEALALLLVVPIAAWLMLRRARRLSVGLPTAARAARMPRTWRIRLAFVPVLLRAVALAMLVTAIARPRENIGSSRSDADAIAIMTVVDRSGSMEEPMSFEGRAMARLDVVKHVLEQFVKGDGDGLRGREGDLIGLVAFARFADTICPLVHAHEALLQLVRPLAAARDASENMTAIGDGLTLGVAKLRQLEEDLARRESTEQQTIASKIVILLTDGSNNAGSVDPLSAAALAAEWGIKVYVIGIGAGENFAVVQTPFGERRIPMGAAIDEVTLRQIAETTGGRYWPADDAQALRDIYAEIDRLERTTVRTQTFVRYRERFWPFAIAGAAALMIEVFAGVMFIRRVPG